MRRRPICLLCLLFISILTILYLCGVPLRAAPKGAAEAEALLSTPCVAHLSGRVRSCKTQGDVTYLILENTQLLAIRYGNSQSSGTAPAAVSMKVCLGGVRIALSEQVHYAIGTQIRAAGTLAAIEGPTNPGQFDQKFYYELQGISWNLKKPVIQAAEQPAGNPLSTLLDNFREALALLGESLTARIAAIFPENAAATLAAMLTGDKSLLSKEAKTLYRIGGISHMLAISGLHISLLGMGLYHLLRKLRLPQRAAGLAAAIFLIAYAILTGGSVATVRAVLMFLLYLLAKRTHRVYDVPTALSVVAILLLIENPLYLLYAGFQLSFVAVLALAAFPGHGRLFSGLILYLITLPFTLWHYFTIPLYGILVNLVVVPLLPLVLGAGILALVGSYLLEALGLFAIGSLPLTLLTAPASWLLQAIEHLLGLTARLPLASLPLGRPDIWQILLYVLLLAIFLYVLKKWRRTYRKYALLLALPLLIGIFLLRPAKTLALTFLDVGQGDGIFLELPGAAVLVDGGSSTVSSVGENRVQPFLAYSGIRRLDYLVATHADSDHTNGLREILEAVRDGTASLSVGTLLLPKTNARSEPLEDLAALALSAGIRVVHVQSGDTITLGDASLEVLGPDPSVETVPLDDNAQCIVLGLHFHNFDCLLTGDVQEAGEEALRRKLQKSNDAPLSSTHLDVLKVAHHGSRNSTSSAFLETTQPKVAILSCGRNNRYGHPHDELLSRLEASGAKIYRTDLQGAITIEVLPQGEGFTATTYL